MDRFAAELLHAWLPRYGAARDATIIVPRSAGGHVSPDFNRPVEARGHFDGHLWEQLELPRLYREHVLLNFCNTGPIVRTRQLVFLHDTAVMSNPSAYGAAFRAWYRLLFHGLMRGSSVVASVSNFSAGELTRHFGARTTGIEVVYESGEHILRSPSDPRILERLRLVNKDYVLAVGSRSPNKNFAGVIKAATTMSDLGVTLVAVGGGDNRVFAGVDLRGDNVVLAGYVSDGELRSLYENAQCFVFPSFYEGFGLPPLEAMHCGCPVIVSRRASLPEVCGDAAVYCNPDDPTDIADCIRRVLTSDSLRNELREAGMQRTALFTWRSAAQRLEDIIRIHFDRTSS